VCGSEVWETRTEELACFLWVRLCYLKQAELIRCEPQYVFCNSNGFLKRFFACVGFADTGKSTSIPSQVGEIQEKWNEKYTGVRSPECSVETPQRAKLVLLILSTVSRFSSLGQAFNCVPDSIIK